MLDVFKNSRNVIGFSLNEIIAAMGQDITAARLITWNAVRPKSPKPLRMSGQSFWAAHRLQLGRSENS